VPKPPTDNHPDIPQKTDTHLTNPAKGECRRRRVTAGFGRADEACRRRDPVSLQALPSSSLGRTERTRRARVPVTVPSRARCRLDAGPPRWGGKKRKSTKRHSNCKPITTIHILTENYVDDDDDQCPLLTAKCICCCLCFRAQLVLLPLEVNVDCSVGIVVHCNISKRVEGVRPCIMPCLNRSTTGQRATLTFQSV